MIQKIKISSLIKQNFLLLVFLSVFMGLFLPLQSAWALGWLATAIATAIAVIFFTIFVMVSIFWVGLAEGFLRLVLSPNFINLPYTTNPFVELGWTLTRDFVNMFFILILVIIGLAAALRISEYQWQKTLPRLILIALLINFTPVILGLIIDAANIIMDFFVSGIAKESVFTSQIKQYSGSLIKIIGGGNWLEILLMPLFYIGFNFIAGVMYILFAILFIFRYVALWTLIILSPIAFFCYILPGTKSYFDMWWKQFIQWCLIGIIAAFFIYLADQLLFQVMTDPASLIDEGSEIKGLGALNTLIPYCVVIAFLFIGFFISLQSAPMGTNAIFSAAQKGMKATAKWAGKTGADVTRGIPAVSRAEERIRRRLETVPGIGRLVGGPGAVEKEKKAKIGAATKRMEQIPGTTEGNKALLNIATKRTALTKSERYDKAAAIELLAKRKALDLTSAQAQISLPEAQRYGADVSAIYKARPDLAPHFTKIDPVTKKSVPMTIKDAMDKTTPGDFWQSVQTDAFKHKRVAYLTALDVGKSGKFEQLGRKASKSTKKQFKDTLTKLYTDPITPASIKKTIQPAYNQLSTDANWRI